METIVKCIDVWKIYNPGLPSEFDALRGLNLSIKKGELVSIMGASGSGKSTLLNLIGGLDKPTKGKVIIDSHDLSKMDENEMAVLRRNKIGFVFQSFNLINSFTAMQNVELPMIFNGIEIEGRKEKARKILTEVGLEKKLENKSTKLSGGETQRVSIARALANDPQIILADEPTGNLDSKSGKHIMEILKKLNKDGRTIIVVTHDIKIAKQTKRIIRIADGKVVGK
ncbi:MAG TPA: ABC transporter ATP-binding protein [archaeon]|nr:ABC transporter ATP-binding protein [archaeon]